MERIHGFPDLDAFNCIDGLHTELAGHRSEPKAPSNKFASAVRVITGVCAGDHADTDTMLSDRFCGVGLMKIEIWMKINSRWIGFVGRIFQQCPLHRIRVEPGSVIIRLR